MIRLHGVLCALKTSKACCQEPTVQKNSGTTLTEQCGTISEVDDELVNGAGGAAWPKRRCR